MKGYLIALVVCLSLSLAVAQTPERNVLTSYRIVPVPGKDAQLKKALTDHAAKFHAGTWRWRIFQVLSGPDEGTFQINEGVNSWTELEGRAEISDEHQRDYEKNVLPLSLKTLPAAYLTYQKDFSTDSAAGPLKKALLRHVYLKPGKGGRVAASLANMKKVYEKLGMRVGVWGSFFSGQPQFVTSFRLANGWADLEKPWGKMTRETYDDLFGSGSFVRYVEDMDTYVDKIVEEMIEFLPDASPK